jgi:alpha-L-fucosidase
MHRLVIVALLGAALSFARTRAAAADPSPPCPGAQYTLVGEAVGVPVAATTIEIGPHASIGGACAPTERVSRRSTKRGAATRVAARWFSCPGFAGPVLFKGQIEAGCTRLTGTIRARGQRQRIEAVRSDCGDGILDSAPPPTPYVGTLASLGTHTVPAWYDDAKFGIMIHWGIFTIPAWAELVIDPGDWLDGKLLEPPDYGREFFTHIPYVEWYSNTIRIDGSPAQQHHADTYGAGFLYDDFRPQFEAAAAPWSADTWADAFRNAGARYVVLVTKHHDGFALWPTAVPHPVKSNWNYSRDVVGELDTAVRERCMRMGLYYSGGFDWSVQPGPVTNAFDALTTIPQSPEYIAYADGQWRELIARYRPALLWNDIGYPNNADALGLFAAFYNTTPDGVINDRFSVLPGLTHHDFSTPEFSVLTDISPTKFETVRGMGRGFGYNQNENDTTLDSAETLVRLLVDVVSKNGNLLLNVGPQSDGSIPPEQMSRLQAIGAWLDVNGGAIFGTRPWTRSAGVTDSGTPIRFTHGADGTVYAVVLGPVTAGPLTLVDLGFTPRRVRLLGTPGDVPATASGTDVRLTLNSAPGSQAAYAFALER